MIDYAFYCNRITLGRVNDAGGGYGVEWSAAAERGARTARTYCNNVVRTNTALPPALFEITITVLANWFINGPPDPPFIL